NNGAVGRIDDRQRHDAVVAAFKVADDGQQAADAIGNEDVELAHTRPITTASCLDADIGARIFTLSLAHGSALSRLLRARMLNQTAVYANHVVKVNFIRRPEVRILQRVSLSDCFRGLSCDAE